MSMGLIMETKPFLFNFLVSSEIFSNNPDVFINKPRRRDRKTMVIIRQEFISRSTTFNIERYWRGVILKRREKRTVPVIIIYHRGNFHKERMRIPPNTIPSFIPSVII